MSLLMFSVIRQLTLISCFNYIRPIHQQIEPSACKSPMLLLLGRLGLPTFFARIGSGISGASLWPSFFT